MKRYFCSQCGKLTKVKVPKGGDGSMLVPYRHDISGGVNITCPGSWEEAEVRTINIKSKKYKKHRP